MIEKFKLTLEKFFVLVGPWLILKVWVLISGFVLDKKILPPRMGYCTNANCARRFGCEDGNIDNLTTIVRGR